jgi:hypothetical protein
MPIVSSYNNKVLNKPNNRFAVYDEHVDHLGNIHEHRWYCDSTVDQAARRAEWAANFDAYIAKAEAQRIQKFIFNEGAANDVTSDYLTAGEQARAIITGFMRSDDPKAMSDTATWIDTNVTNTQLNNMFTLQQANRIRNRVDNIVMNKVFLDEDTSEEIR